jgi:hypothetical protein
MKPLPISESVPVAEHRTAEIRHVKAWHCSARKPEAGQPHGRATHHAQRRNDVRGRAKGRHDGACAERDFGSAEGHPAADGRGRTRS